MSEGITQVAIFLVGNSPRGNCPGANCPMLELPGGQLS